MKNIFSIKKSIVCMVTGLMIAMMGGAPFIGLENQTVYGTAEVSKSLSMAERLDDLDYLYTTIEENYPYLEVNKRLYGVDWLKTKDQYIQKVKACKSDEEFAQAIQLALGELHNGHTHVLNRDYVIWMKEVYKNFKESGYWQGMLYDVLDQPLVSQRYGISKDTKVDNPLAQTSTETKRPANVSIADIKKGEIAYIKINQMLSFWEMDGDRKTIDHYLEGVKKYPALVIDIRGNGGGDSRYWSEYLVPKLIAKPYETQFYSFFKDGKDINAFFKAAQVFKMPLVKDLNTNQMKNLPKEVKKDFTYYGMSTLVVTPLKETLQFKGKIYLLVDEGVYSSAEAFAMFAKHTGFATLIGEKTGGDGLSSDPMLSVLPNSGLVIRYTKEMGTTVDGICNEEHKTLPHYIIKNPEKASTFSKDNCIQKVIELEKKK